MSAVGMPPTSVIVHYGDVDRAVQCVRASLDAGVGRAIVIDNSDDIGPFDDDRIWVVRPRTNLGFGRAANLGRRLAPPGPVLVLNTDVMPTRDSVAALVAALDDSGATIAAPILVAEDGTAERPKERFTSGLAPPRTLRRDSSWREVPWVAGAAMMLAADAPWFDDRIFMYSEDQDLCWRAWSTGGSTVLALGATMHHVGAASTRLRWSEREILWRSALSQVRISRWHGGWPAVLRVVSTWVGRRVRWEAR